MGTGNLKRCIALIEAGRPIPRCDRCMVVRILESRVGQDPDRARRTRDKLIKHIALQQRAGRIKSGKSKGFWACSEIVAEMIRTYQSNPNKLSDSVRWHIEQANIVSRGNLPTSAKQIHRIVTAPIPDTHKRKRR